MRRNQDVWVVGADGTGARKVVDSVGNDDWKPAWSADSTRLAYGVDGLKNRGEIKVVDVRTGQIQQLTNGNAYDGMQDWQWNQLGRTAQPRETKAECPLADQVHSDVSRDLDVSALEGDRSGGQMAR